MAGSFFVLTLLWLSCRLLHVDAEEGGDVCVPDDSPWKDLGCHIECDIFTSSNSSVFISNCPEQALTPSNTFPEANNVQKVTFLNSGLTTVKNNALEGLQFEAIGFLTSFCAFEENAFSGFTIKVLSILNNPDLTYIPPGIFNGLASLQVLVVMYNGLTSLPAPVFTGLGNLRDLSLVGNKFSCLSSGLFQPLINVQTLKLSNPETDQEKQFYESIGVIWKENIRFTGICPQTFRGISANVSYAYEVDKCIVECNDGVQGLRFSTDDGVCACGSDDGCEDTCGASSAAAVTRTPGHIVIVVGSVLSVMLHLGMMR